jgi:hypothetical protein
MSVLNPNDALTAGMFGQRIDRATSILPQGHQAAVFNVVGGRILMRQIIGEVTVAVQNQANNTKLVANPTAGSDVDICAVLNIANDEVGTLYGISGLNSTAMIGINAGALPAQLRDVEVAAGTIDLSCAAANTGSVKWSIWYMPIDDGAYVTAAAITEIESSPSSSPSSSASAS